MWWLFVTKVTDGVRFIPPAKGKNKATKMNDWLLSEFNVEGLKFDLRIRNISLYFPYLNKNET